jgi:hypothetical protein
MVEKIDGLLADNHMYLWYVYFRLRRFIYTIVQFQPLQFEINRREHNTGSSLRGEKMSKSTKDMKEFGNLL